MFDYELPKERIAEWPVSADGDRADSRLLHALFNSENLKIRDHWFRDISQLLRPGDLLVLNDTAVRPVRFFVEREGGLKGEIFLLKKMSLAGDDCYEGIGRPVAKFKAGDFLRIGNNAGFEFVGRSEDPSRIIVKLNGVTFDDACEKFGVMPIPPYIRGGVGTEKDRTLYQTVFASREGSIAAPTAALHFSVELLEELKSLGVELAFLTLHVGASSIQPIRTDANGNTVSPGKESFSVDAKAINQLIRAKDAGRRIVAVGTTVVRALETLGDNLKEVEDVETSLFIEPGFHFKLVDSLITNFHQPGSTHLSLVEAFVGESVIESIYSHALAGSYRFLSYGDSMFLDRLGTRV